MKICPSCGNQVADDAAFCASCGHRVEHATAAAVPPPPPAVESGAVVPPPPPPPPPPMVGTASPAPARTNTVRGFVAIAVVIAVAAAVLLSRGSSSDPTADDSNAKSDARNMVSQVESCYTDTQDYKGCKTPANTGLNLGASKGEVEVSDASTDVYTIVAQSKSGTHFTITKNVDGTISRTCDQSGKGGCLSGGTW
jgi:type IV pilus assembly protein PilA